MKQSIGRGHAPENGNQTRGRIVTACLIAAVVIAAVVIIVWIANSGNSRRDYVMGYLFDFESGKDTLCEIEHDKEGRVSEIRYLDDSYSFYPEARRVTLDYDAGTATVTKKGNLYAEWKLTLQDGLPASAAEFDADGQETGNRVTCSLEDGEDGVSGTFRAYQKIVLLEEATVRGGQIERTEQVTDLVNELEVTTTVYTYGERGVLTSESTKNGTRIANNVFTYGKNGKLEQLQADEKNTYQFAYEEDVLQSITWTADEAQLRMEFEGDGFPRSRPVYYRSDSGLLSQVGGYTYQYDDDGNLTGVLLYRTETGGNVPVNKELFTYDSRGNKLTEVVYEYDEEGNAVPTAGVRYTYNAGGRVREQTTLSYNADGKEIPAKRVVTDASPAKETVLTETFSTDGTQTDEVTKVVRTVAGQTVKTVKAAVRDGAEVVQYEMVDGYDADGKKLSCAVTTYEKGVPAATTEYVYAPSGIGFKSVESAYAEGSVVTTTVYEYNELFHLIQKREYDGDRTGEMTFYTDYRNDANGVCLESRRYTAAGDLTERTEFTYTAEGLPDVTKRYQKSAGKEYLYSTGQFTYDENGAQKTLRITLYQPDGTEIESRVYDADGKEIKE